MKNPFNGEEMKLIREQATLPYRKDEFNIVYHAYECEKTKERFTDDELDLININQVYNLYREKNGIPFPEEIKKIREKYDVSAKKMADILGLGSNAYRLYESGEIPSVAIGRLIASIKDAEEFRKQIQFSSHILKETEYEKLIKSVDHLIEKEHNEWRNLQNEYVANNVIDENSGFKLFDINKVANVLAYFKLNNVEYLFKTKVNKLLFYADFLNFKRTGLSMMGLTYRAIHFGPVPVEFERLFERLQNDDAIDIELIAIKQNYAEKIIPHVTFNSLLFSESELKVLEDVIVKFRNKSTSETVDISHEEDAWLENEADKKIISYKKYAFELKAFNNL